MRGGPARFATPNEDKDISACEDNLAKHLLCASSFHGLNQ